MGKLEPRKPRTDDQGTTFGVRVTWDEWRAIHQRSGLNPFDALARSAFVVGCALSEPHDQLMARVREIAESERKRLRAEIQAERAERAKRASERPATDSGPSVT